MALPEAVAALRDNWPAVLRLVPPAVWREVTAAADELRQNPARVRRRVLVRHILDALRASLPAGHPVLVADAAESDMGPNAPTLDEEIGALHALLEDVEASLGPRPEEIMRQAHEWIMNAPAHSPEQVRATGADPDLPALIRLPREGLGRLPSFQFGPDGRPLPLVLAVNELLGAELDPWGVASWWLRSNAWLLGVPAQLFGAVPEAQLLLAARAEMVDD